MYPIQCHAGYPMPIATAGHVKIIGFQASASATGSASEVSILDDENVNPGEDKFGKLLTTTQSIERNCQVLEKKGIASVDGTLECFLPEPITFRNGPSVYCSNIEGGTFKLYRI